jgi:hypothetical protein
VDPVGEIEPYLALAGRFGRKIRYVVDTHVHADHRSPGRDLADAAGAEYVLHADAPAEYTFRGVRDGETLDLGNVSAEVLHTPGHTPEHISLLVTDRTRAEEPWLVFTGHTLMVGDMGRTELASSAEEGAAALFELGLRENWVQFSLLVLVNAFVGTMVGVERSVLSAPGGGGVRGRLGDRGALLPDRLRADQGDRQLRGRRLRAPDRPPPHPADRLALRPARPAPALVGAVLELGRLREPAARDQPGARLVGHGDHEDRPGRPGSAAWRWG